jgi:hypothetical protein
MGSSYRGIRMSANPIFSTRLTYATSTQTSTAVHADTNNFSFGADWTIASTNASFAVLQKAGDTLNAVFATYH